MMIFLDFWQEGLGIETLKHGVGVEWDPRRTAAQVPFHFDGFNPILCVLVS